MKISYRTHPILKMLETGLLGELMVAEEDYMHYGSYSHMFDKLWAAGSEEFAKNIQIITKPFAEAISLSMNKMNDENLVKELYTQEIFGTIIKGPVSLCYWNWPKPEGGHYMIYFHFIETIRGPMLMQSHISIDVDKDYKGKSMIYCPMERLKNKEPKHIMQFDITALSIILNFIKYAQVETKYLPAGQRVKDIDCKYVNDTKSNITYLDSKWFTTLVKSDAFRVRGHFRLQPKKKDGEWTKELIWINEFQKTGYTAPARKLKQDA